MGNAGNGVVCGCLTSFKVWMFGMFLWARMGQRVMSRLNDVIMSNLTINPIWMATENMRMHILMTIETFMIFLPV